MLFDGWHVLSIGAGVVDVGQILMRLQEQGLFEIEHAFFIDGGSAMKMYAVDTGIEDDDQVVELDLLNRVAAGSRNRAGTDLDGLNLYTLLMLDLAD